MIIQVIIMLRIYCRGGMTVWKCFAETNIIFKLFDFMKCTAKFLKYSSTCIVKLIGLWVRAELQSNMANPLVLFVRIRQLYLGSCMLRCACFFFLQKLWVIIKIGEIKIHQNSFLQNHHPPGIWSCKGAVFSKQLMPGALLWRTKKVKHTVCAPSMRTFLRVLYYK